jgi:hypothetical protein
VGAWDDTLYDGRLRALARPQNLVMVNKGVGDRGFMVCAHCGLAEPEYGPGYTHTKLTKGSTPVEHRAPLEAGRPCKGELKGPLYLGHQFLTDVLLLRLRVAAPLSLFLGDTPQRSGQAARIALTSIVEAIALAAARVLQIDEGELAGNWSPVLEEAGEAADVYLYDLLPGGAGYTHQVRLQLDAILAAAEQLVLNCDCSVSCYKCLRHYNNQTLHTSLDRHLARTLLAYVMRGEVPVLTAAETQQALRPLVELLRLRGLPATTESKHDVVHVPLQITLAAGETWVDVHHPLVDPELAPSPVQQRALELKLPCLALDAHQLVHGLPTAVTRLLAPPDGNYG